MAKATVADFLEGLGKSRLLDAAQLERVRDEFGGTEGLLPARDVARRLVERGWLTRWQAEMILSGYSGFFLGKYRLIDRLGVGGMGSVFKAQHGTLRRTVAVKVMARSLLKSPTAIARFQREIQAAAALDHPHIVAAFDAESSRGQHFLVMEYVDGRNLAEVSAAGPLPIAWSCECVRQVALGLQHAHEQGMVHRDIKPSNILLVNRPAGDPPLVKLLDMGLARVVSETVEEGDLTQSGQVMGTPDFISPEQARNSRDADIRSDLYSLGCTLYRLLTGELPFPGQNVMEKLMARALHDAPPLRARRPETPAGLEAVVAQMMARQPADRYQTPAEAAAALAPFAAPATAGGEVLTAQAFAPAGSLATPATPDSGGDFDQLFAHLATEAVGEDSAATASNLLQAPETPTEGPRSAAFARSRRAAATASTQRLRGLPQAGATLRKYQTTILLGVIAALLFLAIGVWAWKSAGMATLTLDWDAADRVDGTLELDGRRLPLPAEAERVGVRLSPGRHRLRIERPGYESVEEVLLLSRGETVDWAPPWRPLPETRRRLELARFDDDIRVAEQSGWDGQRVEELRNRLRDFGLRNRSSGQLPAVADRLARLPAAADRLQAASITPVQRQAALAAGVDALPEELAAIFGERRFAHARSLACAQASPDGRILATGADDGRIRLWEVATGRLLGSFDAHPRPVRSLAFVSQGERLVSSSDDGAVVWNVAARRREHILRGHEGGVWAVAAPSDGQVLATAGADQTVRIWSAQTGLLLHTFSDHAGPVRAVAFDAEGMLLASGGQDGTVRLRAWNADEPAAPDIATFPLEFITGLAFSPADGQLAVVCEKGRVWLVDPRGDLSVRVPVQPANGVSAAFSADGRRLAIGQAWMGGVTVWNVANDVPVEELRRTGHGDYVTIVQFLRDKQTLLSASRDGTVRLDDLKGSHATDGVGHSGPVQSVLFDLTGERLYSAGTDGMIREWDVATGQERRVLDRRPTPLSALALSPDGVRLVASGYDGIVRTVSLDESSAPREFFRQPGGIIRALDFDAEGQLLAAAVAPGDSTVRLFDGRTGQFLRALPPQAEMHAAAFSPDGTILTAGSRNLTLWDVRLQNLGKLAETQREVYRTLDWSPDGTLLAAGRQDGHIELYEVRSQTLARVLTGPYAAISRVRFSPDGRRVAASAADGSVRVHDAASGDLLHTFPAPARDDVYSGLAISPEGRHLATANANGTIFVYRLARRLNEIAGGD